MRKNSFYLVFMAVIFSLVITTSSFGLAPVPPGIGIGGAIMDPATGSQAFNQNIQDTFLYAETEGDQFQCSNDVTIQTGASTNSFYLEADFNGCPAMDGYRAIGSLSSIGVQVQTFLDSGSIYFIDIYSFSRTTPNSPMTISIELVGFPLNVGETLRMTPRILDENDNLLFTGSSAIGLLDGNGWNGAPLYTFTIDAIPNEIVASNIIRHLQIELASLQGEVVQIQAPFDPFPLTYGCIELLQLGPAGFISNPTPVNVEFGCPGMLPPDTCEDSTSAAIAASRKYKKATRKIVKKCVKKQTTDCSDSLVNQVNAYQQLIDAQERVETY